MDEVWKDIDDFEGYYQISNFGRIRSCDRYVNSKSGSKRLVRGKINNCYVGHGGFFYISLLHLFSIFPLVDTKILNFLHLANI